MKPSILAVDGELENLRYPATQKMSDNHTEGKLTELQ